jgi:hypothetical protein
MGSSGMFGAKQGPETKTSTSTQYMNPQQQKYFSQALDMYGGQLGKNNVYQGQRVASFSPLQNSVFDFANSGGFITSPEQTRQYFDSTIKNPAITNYQNITAPGVKEAYAGPGYWGSARAGAERGAAQDLTNQLNADWANLNWNVQQANKQGAKDMYDVGSMQQQQEQNMLNAAMQKFAEENQITDPTNLAVLMDLLGMKSSSSSQARQATTTPSWHTGDWAEFGAKLGLMLV